MPLFGVLNFFFWAVLYKSGTLLRFAYTADLGINLADAGNRRTILLPMTYDPTEWKSTWTGDRTRSSWVDLLSRQMTEIVELRNMADAEDSYA